MQNDDQLEELFSEDPEENLRIENDILKLKLQLSYGAGMMMASGSKLPPRLENEFLKHVIAFEQALDEENLETIYLRMGRPDFDQGDELSDEQVSKELIRLRSIMADHAIHLDILGVYEDRVIYNFITEELFSHEVLSSTMPGFMYHFIYEEFHPNHSYDIENRVREFLTDWFEQKFDEYSFELADPLIVADGRTMKKEELVNRIKMIFDSYPSFTNEGYNIEEINYQLNEVNDTGMGYAEGNVKYYARLEDGHEILIGGPFKFYLSHEENWWQIFYFSFPGFEW